MCISTLRTKALQAHAPEKWIRRGSDAQGHIRTYWILARTIGSLDLVSGIKAPTGRSQAIVPNLRGV